MIMTTAILYDFQCVDKLSILMKKCADLEERELILIIFVINSVTHSCSV